VSIDTPEDTYVDKTVETTVEFKNKGNHDTTVDFDVYLCKSDGTNCKEMDCEHDTRITVQDGDTESIQCDIKAKTPTYHKIKVTYDACDDDPTRFSGIFKISPKQQQCREGLMSETRCYGNIRQQKYINTNCETIWRNIEFCANGCTNNACVGGQPVPPAGQYDGVPMLSLKSSYDVKACEINDFTFEILNAGSPEHSFLLAVTGDASDWIQIPANVTVPAHEKVKVKGYAKIPCDARGDHSFTITATGSPIDSATSKFAVKGTSPFTGFGTFATWEDLAWLIVAIIVIIIVIVLLLLLSKPSMKRRGTGSGSRCYAEGF
jgi:hypothetical protein